MLFGELSAISMADSGEISKKSFEDLDFENLHLQDLEEMRHFEEDLELEKFVSTGIAHIEEFNVVAIPTLIHEEPERLVGMGDVISAGSFAGEIS
jgi:ADP-dependent phosphofructokinase/glucokinase